MKNKCQRVCLSLAFASALCNAAATTVDVRTYVPYAAASGGYESFLRVINLGASPTPVTVARIDGATGAVGPAGQLTATLREGAAVTFSAQQVESALGVQFAASDRPRIRIGANTSIEAQSFLLQPGGAFNEVSTAQSGSSVTIPTYVPAAAAPSGYESYLRFINTGQSATLVRVTEIDPVTGQSQAAATLISSLAVGAAVTFSAAQVESALGISPAAADRPTLTVTGVTSPLDVQSFLIQPGGAFTDLSSLQDGTTVAVRSYVPAANTTYTSYLRVVNDNGFPVSVTASVINDTTGVTGASGTLISSLAGNAAQTLSSSQIESALQVNLAAADRPRIQVTASSGTVTVQSFLLQPGGAYNEISGAQTGTTVQVRTYIPAADAATGYTTYLRVINTGISATPVSVALIDGTTGVPGLTRTLIASLPAGAAQTLSSSQVETALGSPVTKGSRPRLQISSGAGDMLEVQSFLIQPGSAFTEVSGGQ